MEAQNFSDIVAFAIGSRSDAESFRFISERYHETYINLMGSLPLVSLLLTNL